MRKRHLFNVTIEVEADESLSTNNVEDILMQYVWFLGHDGDSDGCEIAHTQTHTADEIYTKGDSNG